MLSHNKPARFCRQFGLFHPPNNPRDGVGFERLMLGDPVSQNRKLTEFERKMRSLIFSKFELALFDSTVCQAPGYPWGNTGFQIDHVVAPLRKWVDRLVVEKTGRASEEGGHVFVFSTINTALDKGYEDKDKPFATDCFFLYRGTVATIDLTLKNRKRYGEMSRPHFLLQAEDIGDDDKLRGFCSRVAEALLESTFTISPALFSVLAYRMRKHYLKNDFSHPGL